MSNSWSSAILTMFIALDVALIFISPILALIVVVATILALSMVKLFKLRLKYHCRTCDKRFKTYKELYYHSWLYGHKMDRN